MRISQRWAVVTAGILVAVAFTPAAWGQRRNLTYNSSRDTGGVYVRVPINVTAPIRVQTTVTVPDGGTALVARYNQVAEVRSEYGAPVLGKIPVIGRTVRNVGYGRNLRTTRVGVSVRVIDRREEEYRQTGFRSP
jgi:Flp pilus assembly secretin CpaC